MTVEEIFKKLKKSENNLYVWGAGSISIKMCDRLKAEGLNVKGRFVDIPIEKCSISESEFEVFELNNILQDEPIDVVVGHGHVELSENLYKYPQIKNVYIIINPYTYYPGLKSDFLIGKEEQYERIKGILFDDTSKNVLEAYFKANDNNDYKELTKENFIINNMFDLEGFDFSNDEVYFDIGAFDGDTIKQFLKKVNNNYSEIHAFEPNPNSFNHLKEFLKDYHNSNGYMMGLSDHDDVLKLGRSENESSFLSDDLKDSSIDVEVKKLDDVVNKKIFPTTIKISTPFMVYNILKGAKQTIEDNKPKLIINLGSGDDTNIFEIMEFIYSLNPNYKFVLRYDMPIPVRLFLFCY